MLWGFEDESDMSLPSRNSESSSSLLGGSSVHTPGSGIQGRRSERSGLGGSGKRRGKEAFSEAGRGLWRWAWMSHFWTSGRGRGEGRSKDRGERSHTVTFAMFAFSLLPLVLTSSLSFLSQEF